MKYIILKRSYLLIVSVVLVLCVVMPVHLGENAISAVFFGDNLRKVPIYNVETTEKRVAITFDAAWGADKTEKIMQILKEYNANATFFLVGFWVEDYPEVAKKIAENGFEIGTHSSSHPDMAKLDQTRIRDELAKSVAKIEEVTNQKVELFRAPFGSYNNLVIDTASSLGLTTIQWDVDTLDWKGISGSQICTRVLNIVKNGSIILCHNNSDHILDALPILLDRLILKGYTVGCVGDLIYKDNYTIDRAGVQKSTQNTKI